MQARALLLRKRPRRQARPGTSNARQYVLDSDWGDVQPSAGAENKFLESHSWDEYAEWHLGLTDGATNETKARYGLSTAMSGASIGRA